jgi:hypothetical protein
MGSVFSQSMDILGKNFWKFSGAVLLAWAAFLVLTIPLTMLWFGVSALFQSLGTSPDIVTLGAMVPTISTGALAIIAIVTALSFPMASIAYGTVQELRGQPFSFSQSMGWALRHLASTGIATCLWSIAFTAFYGALIAAGIALYGDMTWSNNLAFIGVLFVCAILGGMFLYARFLILIPAIVAEGLGPIAGLQRSYRLTAGYTLRIWFMTFLLWLIFLVIGAGAQFIPLIGPVAANVVYSALSGVLAAVIYVELRRTKESFGIEEYARVFD